MIHPESYTKLLGKAFRGLQSEASELGVSRALPSAEKQQHCARNPGSGLASSPQESTGAGPVLPTLPILGTAAGHMVKGFGPHRHSIAISGPRA